MEAMGYWWKGEEKVKVLKRGNRLVGNLLSQDAGRIEIKWKVSYFKMDTYYSQL